MSALIITCCVQNLLLLPFVSPLEFIGYEFWFVNVVLIIVYIYVLDIYCWTYACVLVCACVCMCANCEGL